ncbi:hypothetical protein SELMODRAFT_232631 [Selaginella moellendorffii]|uniref:chitinase n=1 Tax=Selaginella moellendorffii TaxID=88036 RepID=D8RXT0_SELML|nr:hypothetical protein SELMODRAFT_232631 [Selaginella moellendorffii]
MAAPFPLLAAVLFVFGAAAAAACETPSPAPSPAPAPSPDADLPDYPPGRGKIAAYWGQHDGEDDLDQVCSSGNYRIVMLAFLASFGNFLDPVLNLANHCDPSNGGCKAYSSKIKACQAKGVQIILSIGGGASGGYLVSDADARDFAEKLWNSYLGGHSSDRPLGSAVLNGIDLDIEGGGIPDRYGVMKKLVVTAAPQCPFPDLNLGTAIQIPGLFDYLFVQFYNNPCGYGGGGAENLLDSWKQWTTAIPTAKIFLGLPASPSAAGSGFLPPNVCKSSVLPEIKRSKNYGGVMFWSVYYDQQEQYSEAIRSSV